MSYQDHWRGSVEDRLAFYRAALPKLEARTARLEALLSALAATGGGSAPSGGPAAIRVAKAATAITASSATTPGSGSAQPLKLDGSGDYAADGDALPVKNAGAAVTSGKRGFAIKVGDQWWFTPEECG